MPASFFGFRSISGPAKFSKQFITATDDFFDGVFLLASCPIWISLPRVHIHDSAKRQYRQALTASDVIRIVYKLL